MSRRSALGLSMLPGPILPLPNLACQLGRNVRIYGKELGGWFGVWITCHTDVWTLVCILRRHTKAKHSNTCVCNPCALMGSWGWGVAWGVWSTAYCLQQWDLLQTKCKWKTKTQHYPLTPRNHTHMPPTHRNLQADSCGYEIGFCFLLRPQGQNTAMSVSSL